MFKVLLCKTYSPALDLRLPRKFLRNSALVTSAKALAANSKVDLPAAKAKLLASTNFLLALKTPSRKVFSAALA